MSKKIIFGLAFFIFLFSFKLAHADVVINEIKYSPTTDQWIEIYNDTDSDVDITAYKILDNSVKTGHSIYALDNGSNLIPSHGFGIIAEVPSDFSSTSFPVFKGSLNIKVSSDSVKLLGSEASTESVIIDGSATKGNSWQLQSDGSWKPGAPTPGAENTDVAIDNSSADTNTTDGNSNSDSVNNSNTDNTSDNSSSSNSKPIPTIKAKILAEGVAFAGLPVEISSRILGYSNEVILPGKYFWNFGDGTSITTANSTAFSHTYLYPGEYNISLEYYLNTSSQISDATSKFTMKIVPLAVSISKVGDAKDFFVELANDSSYDVDISNWTLNANGKIFVFPKNSVILSKDTMTISGRITGFVLGDENNLKLEMPSGDVIFDYSASSINSDNQNATQSSASKISAPEIENSVASIKDDVSPTIQVPNKNLSADAIDSNVDSSKNSFLFFGIFAILLLGAGVGVYFIRRKKNAFKTENGEDFEILSE